ncbi:MAG: hypothetical protein RSC28_03105 [Bacteroidales bacterium]
MEKIEGGGINACDVSLGLVVGIWSFAFGAASFRVASFLVGYGGSLLVGSVCHRD